MTGDMHRGDGGHICWVFMSSKILIVACGLQFCLAVPR